jgi:SAM-dependent methyltransferase
MWTDIIDLRAFYAGALGKLVHRLVAGRLRQIWPKLAGMRVLGVGFAAPYLELFQGDAERVLAAMPAGQGCMHWPAGAPNLAVLTGEEALPFPDRSIDRLLLVHCLEGSAHLRPFMRECWRVLADGGRLTVVVANRRGLWARAEHAPFAQGQPYSMGQLTRLLRDNLFVPLQSTTALFVPPVGSWLFRAWATTWENLGAKLFPTFAGVVIVEAEKQIYAAPFDALPARAAAKVMARPAGNGVASRLGSGAGEDEQSLFAEEVGARTGGGEA